MRKFFAGVYLELFGNTHILGALDGLRVDHVGDDGLVLTRQVFVEVLDQLLARNRFARFQRFGNLGRRRWR